MRLYLKTDKKTLFRRYFMYADTKELRASRFFYERGIHVRFIKQYKNEAEPYRIVVCSVSTKDTGKFADAIQELSRTMNLIGYNDYDEWCDKTFDKIKEVAS